jgi:Xaa-Pro dipeptidase
MRQTFKHISLSKNISEYEVSQFILRKFKENNLKSDRDPPIVAFGKNTAYVHYFPAKKSSTLKNNSLILIDIWGRRVGSLPGVPFADITWMGAKGKPVSEAIKIFNIVLKARDSCIRYIKNQLKKRIIPTGAKIDRVACKVIIDGGYGANIKHSTGHCIGFTSPHGIYGRIKHSNNKRLHINLGYTIEPGIYLKNRFGARSEIDFYITQNWKLIITTPIQKKIIEI